jgi:Predicted SAM-dependent methyltransferase
MIALNKALLDNDFGITYWDIPEGNLCPTIPSRINYLNWIQELLEVNMVVS